MQRTRAVVLTLLAALIFGLLASVAIYRYLKQQEEEIQRAKGQLEQVVVAAVDIPAGASLIAEQLRTVSWPSASLPPGTINNPLLVLGRLAFKDFVVGEPILESKLAPKDVTTGVMTFIIPLGKRAITVGVDQVSGVSGFILPNSYVDVIVTTQPTEGAQIKVSRTVLQNMRVLAVGQILEQKEGQPVPVPTVTLAVTPDEAERLALASTEGRLQLVLRKFGDQEEVQTKGVTITRLLSPPGAAVPEKRVAATVKKPPVPVVQPAPSPPPPPTRTVEVIRAGKGAVEKTAETFAQDPQGKWRKK